METWENFSYMGNFSCFFSFSMRNSTPWCRAPVARGKYPRFLPVVRWVLSNRNRNHNSTSGQREQGVTQAVRTQARARARRLGCEAAEAAPRILSSVARRAPVQPVGAAEPAWQDRPLPVRLALRLRGAAHALQLVDLHLGRRDDGSPAKVARKVPG